MTLDLGSLEVLVFDVHELALRYLVGLHDLVIRDGFVLELADLLVADRSLVLAVHEVEVEAVFLDCAEHPHGHVHEAERDRAGPDRASHGDRVVPPVAVA